jgi:type I restriction enzyme S subunit
VLWATPFDLAAVNGSVLGSTARTLTREGLLSGSAVVPGGSLLVSTRAPIGYVAETLSNTAFNQGCRGLVPRSSVDTRFFRYQLLALHDELQGRGQGTTFLELSADGLASTRVLCPTVTIQAAVADYLDGETARIDALVANKHRTIKLIEERWRSERIRSVLHDLDPITGEGRVPNGWAVVRLGVLLALHRGFDLPADVRTD